MTKAELLALKYQNIDFLNKCAFICCQLGRTLSADPEVDKKIMLKHEILPKTQNSIRNVMLPDFVLEEILLERKRYEKKHISNPAFVDLDYILCQEDGRPLGANFYKKPYDHLMKKCKITRLPWRKFRNTYATLMAKEKVTVKAISENLGHFSTDFTNAVYVEHKPILYDIGNIMEEYVLKYDLLPECCVGKTVPVYTLPNDTAYMKYLPDTD